MVGAAEERQTQGLRVRRRDGSRLGGVAASVLSVTGTTRRRRATAEQCQEAERWLLRVGRAVTPEAVAELAPHVRVQGKPELREVQAFVRLVRLGQVPTAAAVRGEMVALEVSELRRKQRRQVRDEEPLDLDSVGSESARWVQQYRARTGHGPSWMELGQHNGWSREVVVRVLPRLRRAGWLQYDDRPGSLQDGPACEKGPVEGS